MPFHPTAQRLWKSLTPEERLAAAAHFWKEPPAEVAGTALGVLVKARHLRPQAARALDGWVLTADKTVPVPDTRKKIKGRPR